MMQSLRGCKYNASCHAGFTHYSNTIMPLILPAHPGGEEGRIKIENKIKYTARKLYGQCPGNTAAAAD